MKRILGLDLGTKTIGIALTDELGIAAHGYETFRFEEFNYKKAREHVIELCEKFDINEIALGIPYYASGDLSPRAKSCLRFKDDLLKLNPNLKIEMIDESYSTIEADELLKEQNLSYYKRKEIIDEMASVVILNRYLSQKEAKNVTRR